MLSVFDEIFAVAADMVARPNRVELARNLFVEQVGLLFLTLEDA